MFTKIRGYINHKPMEENNTPSALCFDKVFYILNAPNLAIPFTFTFLAVEGSAVMIFVMHVHCSLSNITLTRTSQGCYEAQAMQDKYDPL